MVFEGEFLPLVPPYLLFAESFAGVVSPVAPFVTAIGTGVRRTVTAARRTGSGLSGALSVVW